MRVVVWAPARKLHVDQLYLVWLFLIGGRANQSVLRHEHVVWLFLIGGRANQSVLRHKHTVRLSSLEKMSL